MSLYKDASLVMIPSAYKDGKLYSIRPTDGSGDFTFSRGSNLAATRVDVNGLIEKGRENLLTYSNDFSQWSVISTSINDGQTGYDGSSDAWILEATSAGSGRRIQKTISVSGVQTYSFYAKAGSANWAVIGSTNFAQYFDLQNGIVGTGIGAVVDATIESVGSGWYRCSMTESSSSSTFQIYVANADNNTSVSIGDNIYIQDAQLEAGLVATDYIETGASTAQAGILEDMPRLDYSGGASCPALLLEPQRTNLWAHSEYFDAWNKQSVTIDTNVIASPEGVNNASKLTPTATNAFHAMYYATTTSTSYVVSVFAKAAGYDYLRMYDQFASGMTAASFDLINGTSVGGDIEPMGDGWYRCTAYGNNPSAGTNIPTIGASPDGTQVVFTGDGTSGIYIYGAQFESGISYPTSYIPTYGSSVTRSYDTLNDLDLNGIFSGNSYTILFDIDLNTTFNNKVFAEAKKSTGSSSFTFRNFNGLLRVYNNLDSNYLTGSIASDSNKWLVRIDGSTADIFSYNSGSPTKTNGTALTTIRDFGKINFSGGPTISSLNQFLIFPTALSDAECNSLVE